MMTIHQPTAMKQLEKSSTIRPPHKVGDHLKEDSELDEWMWLRLQKMEGKKSNGNGTSGKYQDGKEEIKALVPTLSGGLDFSDDAGYGREKRNRDIQSHLGTKLLIGLFLILEGAVGILVAYLSNQ